MRAVGTREAVLARLAEGEIGDPAGMASTVLAEAVGYPGSSAAFAQLLSGMDRAGLIEREIRGKRTYRIAASATPPTDPPGMSGPPGASGVDLVAAADRDGAFDYDELARRLLVQVVQRLAAGPAEPASRDFPAAPGEHPPADLPARAQTMVSLERELASAATRQRKLTAENARLREQLRAARRGLARIQEQAGATRVTGQLGPPELELLERLLAAPRGPQDQSEETAAPRRRPRRAAGGPPAFA
jgi:hypothetical protein